ncbi:arsenite-transporting ATPase [Rhodococcus sp. 27YEA15]
MAAAERERVLLVSTDPLRTLAGVLGVGPLEQVTAIGNNLEAWQIDTLALLENGYRGWSDLIGAAGVHEHGAQFESLEPEELTGSLGIQDILGLAEIERVTTSGDYDVVIVDCSAAGQALSVLAAPAMTAQYLERLWPRHRRMVALGGADVRLMVLVSVVERIVVAVERTAALLTDRATTSVRLITSAEGVAATATRMTLSALSLSGLRVGAIAVNGVVPQFDSGSLPSAADQWTASIRARQLGIVDALRENVGCVPVVTVEQTALEPVGLDRLREIAEALTGDFGVGADAGDDSTRASVRLESGSGVESVYVLRMYLPLVDPSSLSLGRVEDDVLVGADGVRRRVRLASVLRRCIVSGAELTGNDLIIRFEPDPAVWPA